MIPYILMSSPSLISPLPSKVIPLIRTNSGRFFIAGIKQVNGIPALLLRIIVSYKYIQIIVSYKYIQAIKNLQRFSSNKNTMQYDKNE
jgi:hypothetical protein